MRLNIFLIPPDEIEALAEKLTLSGASVIKEVDQDGWRGQFFHSTNPAPSKTGWAEYFSSYFDGPQLPRNHNHYAAFLFTKGERCYILSFSKSHFYIRPHCDYDFGIELAKRIADESDTRQTSARRFQGRRKKDIKSYATNSRLDVESGESVDFIQAAVIESRRGIFGKTGKFGTSALLSVDVEPSDIGLFLTELDVVLNEPPLFALPRTTIISEQSEVAKLDELLLDELTAPVGTSQFSHNTYDLYGVDFVFSNDGTFTLSSPLSPRKTYDDLSMRELKLYIGENSLNRDDILKIKVRVHPDGAPAYTKSLKEAIDFIPDGDQVVLTNGKWMRFNQDYLDFLDNYLQTIAVEPAESQFLDIVMTETEFNASAAVAAAGYELADKNFNILRTRATTPIEAWDLRKAGRVYAVKFATPQKLGYVCDQAMNVLELLRNRAGVSEVPDFDSYCLWLGYRAQNRLGSITDTGSIILKQKIEAWARKARDLGIEPVLKISRKLKPGVEIDL